MLNKLKILYYAPGIFRKPLNHFSQDFSFNLDSHLNSKRSKNNLEVQVGLLAIQLHFFKVVLHLMSPNNRYQVECVEWFGVAGPRSV